MKFHAKYLAGYLTLSFFNIRYCMNKSEKRMYMSAEEKSYVYDKAIINRINRLQGQINGAKK
jgi:hypothetical protein